MSNLSLISKREQQKFEAVPFFTKQERISFFSLPKELKDYLKTIRTPTNKVGFLIQYAYFKKTQRFFVSGKFKNDDILYACNLLRVPIKKVDIEQYREKAPMLHRRFILDLLKFKAFDKETSKWMEQEISQRIEHCSDLRKIFLEILDLLVLKRVQIPSYHRLSELISKCYDSREKSLIKILSSSLPKELREKLEALIMLPGFLNQLKNINQSMHAREIQESVTLFKKLEDYFMVFLPTIQALQLSHESSTYYATWVKKAKLSQLKQSDNKTRYLYLIAFIQHQFYLMQDSFLEILVKCVQATRNSLERQLKEADSLTRNEKKTAINHLSKSHKNYKDLVTDIKKTAQEESLEDSLKVKEILTLISTHEEQSKKINKKKVQAFEDSLQSITKDKDYFDLLEKLSRTLQQKASPILKALFFNKENSDSSLIDAINHFKTTEITFKSPMKIFTGEEKEAIGSKKDFRISLYKALLFFHVVDGIRSGRLNLQYSYQYLSIQDYLVSSTVWKNERESLLKITDLESFSIYKNVIKDSKSKLHKAYISTNRRFFNKENLYLSFNKRGKLQIKTPPLEADKGLAIVDFLEQNGYVSVLRVLSEINAITGFTNIFKHHNAKYAKSKPSDDTFFAGIIGLGCNIGVPKMAQISIGINKNTLLNTINWHFRKSTLLDINKCFIKMISKLKLPNVYIKNKDQRHGSSDGQKFVVGVDSLLSNHSYKYFGRDKGVTVYTFIDERQALFYLLVHNSADRESSYVTDGLIENDLVNIDLHSTDTYGYTECVFAVTHLLNITFAPRIKNITKQNIYSFLPKKLYEKKGFKILPTRPIDEKLLEKHWEEILRFMVTLKLKEITPSQLFKRLSSYAKDHPLYQALKEFGRIIKSIFILNYYNDLELRQRIEKQLNRIENSNKFSNAVFYANNREFKQSTKEEQEIATACKVIIQNAIVLWNYLYISQMLTNSSSEEKSNIIRIVKRSSIMAWRHINLHGEFDFKRQAVNKNIFDMDKILSLNLEEAI